MYYRHRKGPCASVDSVSFEIEQGKALGIAGESGCGKTSIGSARSPAAIDGRIMAQCRDGRKELLTGRKSSSGRTSLEAHLDDIPGG